MRDLRDEFERRRKLEGEASAADAGEVFGDDGA